MKCSRLKYNNHLDISVKRIIKQLYDRDILENSNYNAEKFYELYKILNESFVVPETSITQIMSRILFSIGFNKNPKVMVGAGTYTGNALAWLSGYYLIDKLKEEVKIYGLDISSEATDIAKSNFSRINAKNVTLIKADAINWIKNTSEHIDLLYIDIDTDIEGKSKYIDLLNEAYPKMNSGGLIVAHDINEEKFKEDMNPFIDKVLDQSMFKSSINLDVDSYGLSISMKR